MIYGLARWALFILDAETSHDLTLGLLSRFPVLTTAPFRAMPPDDPVEKFGLRFRNRIGLAAGLDKNGDCLEAWDRLGFGFVEIGTVTPRPQPGNPKPRMFRLPEQQALINRLGFNNKGVDYLVARVRETPIRAVLGINIGKNADTPLEHAADDYELCLRKVYPYAGYVTVNISSPNTRNLRDLQQTGALAALLRRLMQTRAELEQKRGRRVPLLLKIAPDNSSEQLREIARVAREQGMDGLVATNTTVQRPGLEAGVIEKELLSPALALGAAQAGLGQEPGGLSGAPLKPLALDALKTLRAALGPDFPLVGVGGILSGADARDRRKAGADLIQIYTGFIYQGPQIVAECGRALLPGAPRL